MLMDAAAGLERNPLSKHNIHEQAGRGTGLPNPYRETKFSGANGDREMSIFPVQLTTSRIGNLTRLIHSLLYVMTIHTYYIIHALLSIYYLILYYIIFVLFFVWFP